MARNIEQIKIKIAETKIHEIWFNKLIGECDKVIEREKAKKAKYAKLVSNNMTYRNQLVAEINSIQEYELIVPLAISWRDTLSILEAKNIAARYGIEYTKDFGEGWELANVDDLVRCYQNELKSEDPIVKKISI